MMTKRYHLLLALLLPTLLIAPFSVPAQEELLEPDKAFQYSASAIDANTVRVQWKITDGYYMYRDRVSFSTDTPGVILGEPRMPAGKLKDDPYFGKIEIHEHQLVADVPVTRTDPSVTQFNLVAKSQGCNEPMGVCYPPLTQNSTIILAAAEPAGSGVAAISDLGAKLGLGSAQENEILDPDEAFQLRSEVVDGNTVVARWQIAPGHYLYKDKFKATVESGNGISVATMELPPGEVKSDPTFGDVSVFHDAAEARIRLARQSADPQSISLKLGYQGCSEVAGICYPPQTKLVSFNLPAGSVTAAPVTPTVTAPPAAAPQTEAAEAPLSEQDSIAESLKSGNAAVVILSFFGFGLLLAFTPCVFPMIPILSSIIVGQGENITTRKAFGMSVTYVLAMAVTYTVVGVIAGLFGQNLQAAFQNPWILWTFAGVFVLLSLSMFGFYNLQLPNSWQSKLTEISNRQQGGTLAGVAIMGFLSALIVGPCVAAPLAGALIYIGQTGDPWLGGTALFALSMGMGLPLIVIGTSAGKLLPRAGGWMDSVKAVFGVLLLAVAIWMLERVIAPAATMMLWAGLLVVSSIYMGALEPIKEGASGWYRLWKGLGVVLLLYGALLVVGASAGGTDYLRPLHGVFGGGGHQAQQHLQFKRIKSAEDLDREVAAASAAGKFVMLDFYADWCTYCKDYEKYVFTDAAVQQALADVVLLQADVTANDDADQGLMKKVTVPAPPSILFFDRQGKEMKAYRLVGYKDAPSFLAHVKKALQ
jgi:thiol:disulfide interchange protein DsbD